MYRLKKYAQTPNYLLVIVFLFSSSTVGGTLVPPQNS